MADTFYRPEPPPFANGWGRSLDREVASIRREMDQRATLIEDHELRLRLLEHSAQDQSRDLQSIPDIEARITMVERGLRLVIWALAALAWQSSPDIAIQILASVSGRSGG